MQENSNPCDEHSRDGPTALARDPHRSGKKKWRSSGFPSLELDNQFVRQSMKQYAILGICFPLNERICVILDCPDRTLDKGYRI